MDAYLKSGKGDDDRFDRVLIRALVVDHRAILFDEDVVYRVGAGGHALVDRLHPDRLGDDCDQFFAIRSCGVVM